MEPRQECGGGDGVDGGAAAGKNGNLRIYVGGLGGNVTVDDLKKTFSSPQLGTVESVEIIRTKGRSFAYLDFTPCSDKGLAKLFSAYNGCMWKGGRLRLEKAREHYLTRLRREWEEDAELSSNLSNCVNGAVGSMSPTEKLVKSHNSENVHLRIFFPKLRQIKPVLFKGTGKHKYSFQRVEVPPLPIHFCDCDEHSGPSDTAKGSYSQGNEVGGMNEEELNMMKSVMNKLFEQEKVSETANVQVKFASEAQIPTNPNDDFQVDEKADEMSDEDNLIMNVVAPSNDKTSWTDAWGQKTITGNEESRASQSRPVQRKHGNWKKPFQQENISELTYSKVGSATEAQIPTNSIDDFQVDEMADEMSDEDNLIINVVAGSNNKITSNDAWGSKRITGNEESRPSQSKPVQRKREIQGKKIVQSNKKCKAALDDEGENNANLYAAERKGNLHDNSAALETSSDAETVKPGSGVVLPSNSNLQAKKFSWRDLVNGRDDGCFRISDVIPSKHPALEKQSNSDNSDVPNQENQIIKTSQVKEVNKSAEAVSETPIEEVSKAGKTTLGVQKYSWRQLVGGSGDSSFSISQILPGMNLDKQELPPRKYIDSSTSKNSRQQNVMETEINTDTLAKSKPDQACLSLSNPVNKLLVGKSSKEACTSQVSEKQLMCAKRTTLGDNGMGETFTFKRSSASMKEWKMARAAISGSRKKKANKK